MAASDVTDGLVPDQYGQVHPAETPELIKTRLVAMENEVQKLPTEDIQNLKDAQDKCPQLLTDSFKLMFLRCELFDANLAAKRYAHYWDERVKLFGPEKAFQPLTLKEALSRDTKPLRMKFAQLLPDSRDPIGRGVMFIQPGNLDKTNYTHESMTRAVWYFLHVALTENEEAQKHGMIFMAHPAGASLRQFDRKLDSMLISSLQGAIPVRLSAFHICQPPSFIKIILPIIKMLMSERTKKRMNLHFGSKKHILDKLESKYGIKRSALPQEIGGGLSLDVDAWLDARESRGE